MTDFKERMQEYCALVENKLSEYFNRKGCLQQTVFDAMRYSIEAGGKRIRPIILLEFCRICSGDINGALPYACALEMIHTYSLIHDDLPCMDNDDMRRGKPSCHKAFGEANALLAGDALLNMAFETMLSSQEGNISSERRLKAAHFIAQCAGADGMIGGQTIDLENEGKDISQDVLLRLYCDKTAALLRAAAVSGVILAGGAQDKIDAADGFALNLGLAFQIVDDILDCTGDQAILGKPIGSDEKNNKKTYVTFNGLDAAKAESERLTSEALKALDNFKDTEFLIELSNYLCNRNK